MKAIAILIVVALTSGCSARYHSALGSRTLSFKVLDKTSAVAISEEVETAHGRGGLTISDIKSAAQEDAVKDVVEGAVRGLTP